MPFKLVDDKNQKQDSVKTATEPQWTLDEITLSRSVLEQLFEVTKIDNLPQILKEKIDNEGKIKLTHEK
jgi:hypothetical protein